MFKNTKKIILGAVLSAALVGFTGCTDASVASHNLSKAAEQFELNRRIVFYNGITGDYILVINGLCSVSTNKTKQLAVTCKTGPQDFKKHYLGLSDNVTYFSEQVTSSKVSAYHYKIIFKPSVIIPDIDMKL